MIRMTTTMGAIDIELDFDKAPKSAANFEQYAKDGYFDGTIFHRVIDNFMVQGGGMLPDMSQKSTRDPIENEADNGLKNLTGTLCMARTNDPHSATSQFFINVADNAFLDHSSPTPQGWGYCVFGKVVDGMDVINQIKAVATTSRAGHQDVPVDDIVIEKAEVIEEE
jgi:peptidyl-prolyl cis-trans isomerase B (cyclophilin B)